MAYLFFFCSLAAAWILFFISMHYRRLNPGSILIGIASAAYSIAFDTLFGVFFGLYYYINPQVSIIYLILAAFLIYPPINMIYTLFLPRTKHAVLSYTGVWMVLMFGFELLSFATGTVVLTGWKVIPWSIITYFATYTWILFTYRYVEKRYVKKAVS